MDWPLTALLVTLLLLIIVSWVIHEKVNRNHKQILLAMDLANLLNDQQVTVSTKPSGFDNQSFAAKGSAVWVGYRIWSFEDTLQAIFILYSKKPKDLCLLEGTHLQILRNGEPFGKHTKFQFSRDPHIDPNPSLKVEGLKEGDILTLKAFVSGLAR